MSKNCPPLEVRSDVLLKVIELLKDLDPDSQLRIIKAVGVFFGFIVSDDK